MRNLKTKLLFLIPVLIASFVLGIYFALDSSPNKVQASPCDASSLIEQAKSELLQTTKSGMWYASHLGAAGHWTNAWNLLAQAEQCQSSTTTAATTTSGGTTTTTASGCYSQSFCGGYESGDFTEWDGLQASLNPTSGYTCAQVGKTDANIISDSAQGSKAAAFIVYPDTSCTTSNRAEVYITKDKTDGLEGKEHYYSWYTKFPSSDSGQFVNFTGDWNVFTQFHGPGSCGAQDYLGVDETSLPDKLYLEVDTTGCGTGGSGGSTYKKTIINPLSFDHWYHFIFHVKWSTDKNVGFIQLYVDGQEVIPQTTLQTMYGASGSPEAYWKQGFYGRGRTQNIIVDQDGACVANTFASATSC